VTWGKVFFWLLLISALGGGGYKVYEMTRGIRNKNPGNIRRTTDQWVGLSAEQTDSEYYQFENAVYGIRALGKLLVNYYIKYDLNTVAEIISRYAPSSENDTDSYIASVAGRLGVQPDTALNVPGVLPTLVRAIIKHENGLQPYSDKTIDQGLALI